MFPVSEWLIVAKFWPIMSNLDNSFFSSHMRNFKTTCQAKVAEQFVEFDSKLALLQLKIFDFETTYAHFTVHYSRRLITFMRSQTAQITHTLPFSARWLLRSQGRRWHLLPRHHSSEERNVSKGLKDLYGHILNYNINLCLFLLFTAPYYNLVVSNVEKNVLIW